MYPPIGNTMSYNIAEVDQHNQTIRFFHIVPKRLHLLGYFIRDLTIRINAYPSYPLIGLISPIDPVHSGRPDGAWNLSPAYDLVPVQILLPSDHEELALTLNGKKRRLTAADFAAVRTNISDILVRTARHLTPRKYEHAPTRLTDRLTASLDATLSASFLSENFMTRFRELLKENLSVFNLS